MSDVPRPLSVDYLKFLFACDSEMFQKNYQPIWNKIRADATEFGVGTERCKLTVHGGGRTVGSRYIIELVGPVAEHLKLTIPAIWYSSLRRIDWKTPMQGASDTLIAKVQAWAMLQKKGTRNVSAFNSPNRIKTTARDIGGRGLYFGSRKSDVLGVVYKRAKEFGSYEFRLQNKLCRELAGAVGFGQPDNVLAVDLHRLYELTANAEANLLSETIGCTKPIELIRRMELLADHMPELNEIPAYSQMQFEATHYEQLTTEQQEDDQKTRWTPTEKGWSLS